MKQPRFLNAILKGGDRLRFLWLALCTAGVVFAVQTSPILGFAVFTGLVSLVISFPMEVRRLLFDRPLFFRRPFGGLTLGVVVSLVAVGVLFRMVFVVIAALFTFPDADSVKSVSESLGEAMAEDFRWTLILLIATGTGFTLLLLALDRLPMPGLKAARWSFFRLSLVVGLVYSSLFVWVQERTASAVFPEPDVAQAGEAVRLVFDSYVLDQSLIRSISDLEAELAAQKGELAAIKEAQVFLPEKVRSLMKQAVSKEDNLCEIVGKRECLENRWMWNADDKGYVCISDRYVAREAEFRLSDRIQDLRDAENAIYGLAHCGFYRGGDWCKERTGQLTDDEATEWRRRYGCNNPLDLYPELRETEPDIGEEETGTDEAGTDNANEGGGESDDPGGAYEALALVTIVDAWLHDRMTEVVDRGAVWLDAEWTLLLTGTRPDLEINQQHSLCKPPADDGGNPEWIAPGWCGPSGSIDWHLSLCKPPEDKGKPAWIAPDWCQAPARHVARAVVSPVVLQGMVISLYVTVLLMAFRRRRDRNAGDTSWQEEDNPVWNYKGR